eukprot:TRINITY_DN30758_c0_g1_i2.p6 TRINITY_DN30758_c0_g1~~TRINITY_DN30758_c0_g1_i2.p6  ORF type:complete len:101 (+),score=15.58 TRINITY_DN30758_c0_g1_i2:381-683(+)
MNREAVVAVYGRDAQKVADALLEGKANVSTLSAAVMCEWFQYRHIRSHVGGPNGVCASDWGENFQVACHSTRDVVLHWRHHAARHALAYVAREQRFSLAW